MSAVLRAHQALQSAGVHDVAGVHPERITNAVNEVWRCGPYIVRINPHAGATRLQDEARLLAVLPAAVRAPVAVAAGSASWGEWMVAHRIAGRELSRVWATLRPEERRRAITELGAVMEALHGVPAPRRELPGGPHTLSVDRLAALLGLAADLPGVDRGMVTEAADRLGEFAGALDRHPTTLVHGDLHLENVLASPAGDVTGLLDFEWSRAGPPDLDLDILLHSLAEPQLHLESVDGAHLRRGDFDDVVGWLRDAYPALFAHPRLCDRMWVYRLAYEAPALLAQPPPPGVPPSSLPPYHPYQRMIRLVGGRSDLDWFLVR